MSLAEMTSHPFLERNMIKQSVYIEQSLLKLSYAEHIKWDRNIKIYSQLN